MGTLLNDRAKGEQWQDYESSVFGMKCKKSLDVRRIVESIREIRNLNFDGGEPIKLVDTGCGEIICLRKLQEILSKYEGLS